MSLRFRKRVSFGKVARLNFSMSGTSLSLGPKGASVSFGKNGTYLNTGIPGTGIYSRTKIGGGYSQRSQSPGLSSSSADSLSPERQRAMDILRSHNIDTVGLAVGVNDEGAIEFVFKDTGELIEDADVIKELKRLPEVKDALVQLKDLQLDKWNEMEAEAAAASSDFIDLYKQSPKVKSRKQAENQLEKLEPEQYIPVQYDVPRPTEQVIEEQLQRIAQERSTGMFKKKKAKQYVEAERASFTDWMLSQWEESKKAFEEQEAQKAAALNEQYLRQYEAEKALLEQKLSESDDAIVRRIEEWLLTLDLAMEMGASIECKDNVVFIDLDLPEIEHLPTTSTRRLKSGEVKIVNKTQKQLRQEYAQCVLGLAVYIAANVFNLSYTIEDVLISGYTQRRDRKGDINDDYIYSVKFTRKGMSGKKIEDPIAFFSGFENRMKLNASSSFGAIEPYPFDEA